MGAGVSAYKPEDEEEDIFESQVKEICGDDFDEALFAKAGNGSPFISAGALYKFIQGRLESIKKQAAISSMDAKSEQVEKIEQRNTTEGVHKTVKQLEEKTRALRRSRTGGVNLLSMKKIQQDIRKLKNDYIAFIGVKYHGTDQEFATDFIAEYFSVLDDPNRTVEELANYYTEKSALKFNNVDEFIGEEPCIDAMMVWHATTTTTITNTISIIIPTIHYIGSEYSVLFLVDF
jgi:hypothetical protein